MRAANGEISPTHAELLRAYLRTGTSLLAAKAVGMNPVTARSWLGSPAGKMHLNKLRGEIVQHTKYDVDRAMQDMREAAAFARETENATALVRAHELMMKLHGLLIERVDQRQVGNFQVAISGIDDEPEPEKIEAKVIDIEPEQTTYADVFDE